MLCTLEPRYSVPSQRCFTDTVKAVRTAVTCCMDIYFHWILCAFDHRWVAASVSCAPNKSSEWEPSSSLDTSLLCVLLIKDIESKFIMDHDKYFALKVPSPHTVRKKEILYRKKNASRCIDNRFIIASQPLNCNWIESWGASRFPPLITSDVYNNCKWKQYFETVEDVWNVTLKSKTKLKIFLKLQIMLIVFFNC